MIVYVAEVIALGAYPPPAQMALSVPELLNVAVLAYAGIVGGVGVATALLVSRLGLPFQILGLVTPETGRVLIDGRDLADLDLETWRALIAWVPQKPFLVAGTVADNIRLGRPGASDAEVAAAAERARLDVPLNRQAGVRGTALSGGQVRRLAVARALLRDAPVVLLDEPTEGLDAATEQDVLDVLATELSGRTCVMVTHRAAVERLCDSVLTLGEPRRALMGATA